MDVVVSIEKYSPPDGVRTAWVDGHQIQVSLDNGDVVIAANSEGLRTLAAHMLTLAQDEMPNGNHLHYEPGCGLEDDSKSLVIMRVA